MTHLTLVFVSLQATSAFVSHGVWWKCQRWPTAREPAHDGQAADIRFLGQHSRDTAKVFCAARGIPTTGNSVSKNSWRFRFMSNKIWPDAIQLMRFVVLPCSDLSKNQLSGTLPPEWGSLTAFPRLQSLLLGQNNLTGTLPTTWTKNATFRALSTLYEPSASVQILLLLQGISRSHVSNAACCVASISPPYLCL